MKKIISIFSVMLLLLSGITVYAQEIPQDNEGDSVVAQTEQLLEVDVVNGIERVIDLPETATYSMVADTAASETISERSVIGTDERTKITNTTVTPYYAIAYLSITMEDGQTYRGTGFMISPNTMLTAGHCLKSSTSKAKSVTVYAGRNGTSKPITAHMTKYYVDTKYTGSEADWDYGIMVLDSNIGNTTGWFGLHGTSGSSIGTTNVRVTGYPADLAGYYMWTCAGTVSNITTNRFMHTADTAGGESGSPTYFYNGTYGNQAVGIHTHGGNYSRRITATLVNWLKDNGYAS
ncbi:MAG: trypsin-like serine protease [Lachnospiraceae bacterium]|nr:trypsin-like serine protease [Lachnospiraceae bacterium]